jgi:TDG/mug DNA glycosylase family protein
MSSGFPPLIAPECKLLILGSFPSVISLQYREYYGNPRNDFWKIMEIVLRMPAGKNYEFRVGFLLSSGIGLWDVYESCVRTGSLDNTIKNPDLTPVPDLLNEYQNIKAVICNGRQAETGLLQSLRLSNKPVREGFSILYLPSTSPAHAIPFEEKCRKWMIIQSYLMQ